jgi:hypothetical protein
MKISIAVGLAMALSSNAAQSEPAPRLHARNLEALAPLPAPYDASRKASADLSAAHTRAKAEHKLY